MNPNFLKTCAQHSNKVWHKTRQLAEAEARRLGHPDMDVLQCEYSTNGEWFHLGGQSKKRSELVNGEGSALVFSSSTPEPLTFRPPMPSAAELAQPETPTLNDSNSIEWLLSAAEASGVTEAEVLAKQARDLIAQIVDEVRIGQERLVIGAEIAALDVQISELNGQVAALVAKRDEKIAALRALRPELESDRVYRPVDNLPPTTNQGLIRAWARENGIPVKVHGQISKQVREAYEQAMGVSA